MHQIPIHRVQLSWRDDAIKRCGSEERVCVIGCDRLCSIEESSVTVGKSSCQLGELVGPMMQARKQAIKRGVLVGLCCMLVPLRATAAVSESLCTAFSNAMAEFSAKLPMTVSMPSNATRGKVDKSNALVWLPTTYTEVYSTVTLERLFIRSSQVLQRLHIDYSSVRLPVNSLRLKPFKMIWHASLMALFGVMASAKCDGGTATTIPSGKRLQRAQRIASDQLKNRPFSICAC